MRLAFRTKQEAEECLSYFIKTISTTGFLSDNIVLSMFVSSSNTIQKGWSREAIQKFKIEHELGHWFVNLGEPNYIRGR